MQNHYRNSPRKGKKMLTWVERGQHLGNFLGLGKGLANFGVVVSRYMVKIYENEILRACVRDAEVARSNRVAPIDVSVVGRRS
jgi:hypothetical protein